MSRRDEWSKVKESVFDQTTQARSVEEREKIPDLACGLCKNYSENAYASDGRGSCKILKSGSDISKEPPLYVLEGEAGFVAMFNMDSSKCAHFIRMELIDKDGGECADPAFRRAMRQMEKL